MRFAVWREVSRVLVGWKMLLEAVCQGLGGLFALFRA
jgi:hypothetical protein